MLDFLGELPPASELLLNFPFISSPRLGKGDTHPALAWSHGRVRATRPDSSGGGGGLLVTRRLATSARLTQHGATTPPTPYHRGLAGPQVLTSGTQQEVS
ncbi:hypothetical protein E2C01_045478 [Portunus trituberculatus]|uniref:Uncharacterized protein n=1 Tax=Portunus trituberculatus TaxID=210409 RepID=A0A5B7G253_PORTR|nr:hypothetical protein [Portunus trituberculatus]